MRAASRVARITSYNVCYTKLLRIAKYAIHKAKQLEESLWSIIGICDLMDTTGETLFRLGISLK